MTPPCTASPSAEQITAVKSYEFGLMLQELSSGTSNGGLARIVARDDEFFLLAVTRIPDRR